MGNNEFTNKYRLELILKGVNVLSFEDWMEENADFHLKQYRQYLRGCEMVEKSRKDA